MWVLNECIPQHFELVYFFFFKQKTAIQIAQGFRGFGIVYKSKKFMGKKKHRKIAKSCPEHITLGEISSNLYRASVCDMKKGTFLLISLTQIFYYTLQTSCYGMTKNIFGKLPDHFWLKINTFNFERCHTLTQIFPVLIIIIFFNPIDG